MTGSSTAPTASARATLVWVYRAVIAPQNSGSLVPGKLRLGTVQHRHPVGHHALLFAAGPAAGVEREPLRPVVSSAELSLIRDIRNYLHILVEVNQRVSMVARWVRDRCGSAELAARSGAGI